jgi:hypothetical protein
MNMMAKVTASGVSTYDVSWGILEENDFAYSGL